MLRWLDAPGSKERWTQILSAPDFDDQTIKASIDSVDGTGGVDVKPGKILDCIPTFRRFKDSRL